MTSRPSTAAPILAVLAIVLSLFGIYVAGYVFMADIAKTNTRNDTIRCFPHPWQIDVFTPLGRVEATIRRGTVTLVTTRQAKGQHKDRPVSELQPLSGSQVP